MPSLLKFGVSDSFATYTADTVEMQMNSLLRHWNDIGFRNTVLFLGLEEGSFYEPASRLDVRCFVVVTLRNSPIETIQSEAYKKAGLKHCLTDQDLKSITSAAVRYFAQQSFDEMCKQAQIADSRDIYGELCKKYPVGWMSMQKVATTNSKEIDYPKQRDESPYEIDCGFLKCLRENDKSTVISVVLDG